MISGDARRMRSLYKYEDTQRYIEWIMMRTDDKYFEDQCISKNDIRQFLEYAFIENPKTIDFIKNENIYGALFQIEMTVAKYVDRIKEK